MTFVRALACTLVCLASVAALLFLLPSLKEGSDIEDLPRLLAVVAVLAVLGLAFSWLCRRTPVLLVIGLAFLGPALAAYALLSGRLVVNEIRGRTLASRMRIVRLQESSIAWPGFGGPVGLRIEIELESGFGMPGNLFPPQILMAGPTSPSGREYFTGLFLDFERGYLARPILQDVGSPIATDPAAEGSGPVRLVYDLYPGIVHRVKAPGLVCLSDTAGTRALIYSDGRELGASWLFVSRGGVSVDMSRALTLALRRGSAFQGRPDEWKALLRRLEPESLTVAGFTPCGSASPFAATEACYCRASGSDS
jgi:hypothetical protein